MTLSEWVIQRQETNLNKKKYKQLVQKRKKYFGNKIESKSSNFSIKQNTIVLLLFIVVFIVCILKDLLNHMNKVQVY